MQVYILNPAYEIVGMIDEADSVLWEKKYNDIGEAEIYLPCSTEYLELLKEDNYLYRYDDDMFCKIESVEIQTDEEQGDYIIATAKDICRILAGRIVRWSIVYSGTVAGFFEKVLNDNVVNPAELYRRITNFTIDKSNFLEFTDKIEVSAFTDDLLNLVISTCKAYNYGFRVSYDISVGKLVFRLYKGINKASASADEYIEFSPAFSNILTSSYKTDKGNYKNVVYVGYKDANDETQLLSMYNGGVQPTGEDRREIYVDGTGTSRDIKYEELLQMYPSLVKVSGTETDDNGKTVVVATYYSSEDAPQIPSAAVATSTGEGDKEKITVTDYTYLTLIRSIGSNALAERKRTKEYSGSVDTVDTYDYKIDYDLGDVVRVINEYGIEAEAQIVSVMESDDIENGYQVEPKFEYLN